MSGCVHGIRQSTTALDILQACVEAGYHRLAQILSAMRAPRGTTIIVSGGGSRGTAHGQRLANVLGRPISICSEPEASARGAAVRALELLGEAPPPPRLAASLVPDPAAALAYRAARRRQTDLEALLYPQH